MSNKPRIAILEDHPLMREALSMRITAALGPVEFAYSGASVSDALDVVRTSTVDCVVLDLDLGDGTSPVLNTERLTSAGCRVLVVSALADAGVVRSTLRAGALGYVSKSSAAEEFAPSLLATLRGEASTSRDVASALYTDENPGIALTDRERTAMVLYASGMKMEAVARHMGVKPSTAAEYIKRVRSKYSKSGNPLPSKTHLYRQAREEGLVV